MTIYNLFGTTTPGTIDSGDGNSYVLGLHFKSSVNGVITGVRFYKATANTGTHVARLWKTDSTVLGIVTFTDETSSGWQEMSFNAPIAITANTEYIMSVFVPNGHYSLDLSYFLSAAANGPLTAYKSSDVSIGNSSFRATNSLNLNPFSNSYQESQYWIDVIFDDGQTTSGIGTALSIWSNGEIPNTVDGGFVENDNLGLEFYSAADGFVSGVRFYKASGNTGTHIVNLWNTSGAKLAEKTVSGETSSGWQTQLFDTPVAITANTHYVVSYTSGGHFSYTDNSQVPFNITNSPLTTVTPRYVSGSTPAYPNNTSSFNYWVDVVLQAPSSGLSIPVAMNQYRQRWN